VYRFTPARDAPALLSAGASFLKVGELPKVMDSVQISNLDEPSAHTFHNLLSGTKTCAPVCLPLQEVARVQGVRTEFEDSTKLAGSSCGPEREFLHQGCLLRVDQGLELAIKLGEVRMVLNGVQRCVVTFVTLVLPDVDYEFSVSKELHAKQ
jgi:hypothetical protein